MKRLVLLFALCLPAALASGDTFELSDPANEILEEKLADEERLKNEAEVEHAPVENALCTVDVTTGDCSCIDKEKAKQLSMTRGACVDLVLRALDILD